MAQKFKRNQFIHVNKFQKRILYIVLFPSWLACIISFSSIEYFYYFSGTAPILWTGYIAPLDAAVPWIFLGLCVIAFVIAVWSYYVSNKLVGAFERILSELDQILEWKETKRHLSAREGDFLVWELLKRINALMDKIP